MADRIMLIRHAEKPEDNPQIFGVDEAGNQKKEELSVRGWRRAGALAVLFSPDVVASRPGLATPQTIYATKAVQHSESLRPQHTVAPLALRLGIHLNADFALGEEAGLAKHAEAASGTALIAWHHEMAPSLANAILGDDATCPQRWPGDRFDMVWVFDRVAGSAKWSFSQVAQLVLSGDKPDPIV